MVYGCLGGVPLRVIGERYEPDQPALASSSRAFGVSAVVFRMSCVYGPLQYGNEDQGWVAHVALCALRGKTVTSQRR